MAAFADVVVLQFHGNALSLIEGLLHGVVVVLEREDQLLRQVYKARYDLLTLLIEVLL